MPKAVKGVMIECDESIRAIISKIDSVNHDYIIDDLDGDPNHLVVKENKLLELKKRLEDELAQTQDDPKGSGSDEDLLE